MCQTEENETSTSDRVADMRAFDTAPVFVDHGTRSLLSHRSWSVSEYMKNLKIGIVGGSIAGCCAAIVLSRLGFEVKVLEARDAYRGSQGAGIVVQPDLAIFLEEYGICDVDDITVESNHHQFISLEGKMHVVEADVKQRFTTWQRLHDVLMHTVTHVDGIDKNLYFSRHKVERLSGQEDGKVVVSVHCDGSEDYAIPMEAVHGSSDVPGCSGKRVFQSERYEECFDLLVGADGSGSIVRRTFWPEVQGCYAGYVAWRGTVACDCIPQEIVSMLANKFTMYKGTDFHMLAYLIPSTTALIGYAINWVWYENVSEKQLVGDLLVDKEHRRHTYSVPRGYLRDEIARRQVEKAQCMLPEAFYMIVKNTKDMFLQSIQDYSVSIADNDDSCHPHGNIVLLGDASCLVRPHTAAGTTKAAVDAWKLGYCLSHANTVVEAIHEFRAITEESNIKLLELGIKIGNTSQQSCN